MKIFIKNLSGHTIPLEVSPDHSVDHLRSLIRDKEGIAVNEQRLVFAGHPLENGRTLGHYNVTVGSTIHLIISKENAGKVMRLFVKTLTGKTISIDVSSGATISEVKESIRAVEGVPVDQQQLIFSGKTLVNDRALSNYNIQQESTIHLVIKVAVKSKESREPETHQGGQYAAPQRSTYQPTQGSGMPSRYSQPQGRPGVMGEFRMKVFVSSASGKTFTTNISPNDTISTVKEEASRWEGVPKDQLILLYNGRQLSDSSSLQESGINDGASIQLVYAPSQKRMHLFVKTLTGQTFILYPLSSQTIKEVKEDIQRRESIPVDQQRLIFEGQPLPDELILRDSRLPVQCTVHLVQQSPPAQSMTILVRTLMGKTITLRINSGDSVQSVKRKIYEREGYPPDQISLVFGGKEMENDSALTQYSIQQDSTLLVSFRPKSTMTVSVLPQLTSKALTIDGLSSADSILTLSEKIQAILRIPTDKQKLIFQGRVLREQCTLSESGIQDGSSLELLTTHPAKVMLSVKTPANLELPHLLLSTTQTVHNVKLLLKEETGIATDYQVLMLDGTIMDNSRPLYSFPISHEAVVFLFIRANAPCQVSVQTPSRLVTLDLHYYDTIAQLKSKVQQQAGFVVSQQSLVFNGKQLQDHFTLGDYPIPNRATFLMILHASPLLVIHVVASVGHSFMIQVEANDTVEVLRLRVASELRQPSNAITLVHHGDVLSGSETVVSCGLFANSTITAIVSSLQQLTYK